MRLRRKKKRSSNGAMKTSPTGWNEFDPKLHHTPKNGKNLENESERVAQSRRNPKKRCRFGVAGCVCVCVCVFGDRQLIEAGPQSADDGGRCAKPLWTPMPTCRFWLKPAATRWGPAPPCGGNDPLEDHLELKKKKKKKQKKKKTCYRRAKLDEWVVGVLFRNRIQHPSFLDPMSRLKSSVSKTWSQFYITRYIEGPILKHLFLKKYSSRTQPRVSCIYCLSHQLETAKKRSAALILVHGIRVQCWSKRFELNRSWNAAPIYEMMFAARVIFIDDRSYENPVTAESTLPHTQ